jgi:hypothetical protein
MALMDGNILTALIDGINGHHSWKMDGINGQHTFFDGID